MTRLRRVPILITFISALCLTVHPQSKPPARFVDKGACPFECCTYRRWTTGKTTIGYKRPDKNSGTAGTFKAGSKVMAITGEVRSTPGRYVVTKAHGKYRPRDILWIYTPLGEGFYKVWFKGKMYDEELEYMTGPFEKSIPGCEDTPACWGKLETELKVEWWVKIKSPTGWVGWTNEADHFGNKDACG